jgi:hypothetical protein
MPSTRVPYWCTVQKLSEVGTDVSERYQTEPDNGTDIKLKRVEFDFVRYWIKLFTIIRHLYLLLSMSKVIFMLMKDKHEIA